MEDLVRQKLKEYYERFNDRFPTMELQFESDEELIQLINKCLELNKSAVDLYKIEYEDGRLY